MQFNYTLLFGVFLAFLYYKIAFLSYSAGNKPIFGQRVCSFFAFPLDRIPYEGYNERTPQKEFPGGAAVIHHKKILLLSPNDKRLVTQHYTTPNPPHGHVQWEVCIYESGISRTTVNGIVYDRSARGDVFVLGPNHTHAIEFDEGEKHAHRDIYCSNEDMRRICSLVRPDLYGKSHKGLPPLTFKLRPNVLESVIAELEELEAMCILTDPEDTQTMHRQQSIANGFIHYLLALYIKEEWKQNDSVPLWFYNVVHDISQPEVFSDRINDIIERTNYSHSQFSKIFRQYTGMSVIEYVVNLRLDHAANLLTKTSRSVLDIASAVGYDSVSFFIRIFKKKYGTTPCQYRKNNS